jgi:hypothetical protein
MITHDGYTGGSGTFYVSIDAEQSYLLRKRQQDTTAILKINGRHPEVNDAISDLY